MWGLASRRDNDYLKERRASQQRLRGERIELHRQLLGLLVMTRGDLVDLSATDERFEETFRRLERNVKWAADLAVVLDAPQPVSIAVQVLDEALPEVDRVPPGKERRQAVLRVYKAEDDVIQACRRTLTEAKHYK